MSSNAGDTQESVCVLDVCGLGLGVFGLGVLGLGWVSSRWSTVVPKATSSRPRPLFPPKNNFGVSSVRSHRCGGRRLGWVR